MQTASYVPDALTLAVLGVRAAFYDLGVPVRALPPSTLADACGPGQVDLIFNVARRLNGSTLVQTSLANERFYDVDRLAEYMGSA